MGYILYMDSARLHHVQMTGVVVGTLLLFAAILLVDDSPIQIGMIAVSIILCFGPLLYEPRLQARGGLSGFEGPGDERRELIMFRTGWYAYHLLSIVVLVYLLINEATDLTIPRWGLGFAFIGIFTGFWGIAWWQSRVI